MQINLASRKVKCKIVYYGPGCSGKTTNIQRVHQQMPGDRKSDLTSIATEGDRTLFFDFMSLDLGKVMGMDTCFQLYTVPGQVYYDATRKLVLQGADGLVFVADSSPDRMQANVDSWKNLQENLAAYGLTVNTIPVVIQFNKRDVPGAAAVEELNRAVNTIAAPTFEAVACRGDGVLPTLKSICSIVLKSLNRRVGQTASAKSVELDPAEPMTPTTAPASTQELEPVTFAVAATTTATIPQSEPVAPNPAMVALKEAPEVKPKPTLTTPTTKAVSKLRPVGAKMTCEVTPTHRYRSGTDNAWKWVAAVAGLAAAAAATLVAWITW